jgi:enamine deaminase RidA (YjgF/YER057c/UK114 family)
MLRFLVRVLAAGLAIAVAAIPEANAQEARGARTADNVVNVAGEPEGFPFSPAIKAGGMIYLSGQVGNLPGSLDMAEGVGTVFLDDMEDYWPMNEVYASFWDGPPPARSAFGADGLALGALLEIECIARDPVIE